VAFQLADRVRESNIITGTGNVSLGGALAGFQTFASQMSDTDTTWYALIDNAAPAWEVGVGTWNTGNTLTRTTVLASSNAGALVNFIGNSCDCFMDLPASQAAQLNSTSPQFFLSWFPTSPSYASDSAAAAGGVAVGQVYRNGSAVMCRMS
jgi:hypothetical protein